MSYDYSQSEKFARLKAMANSNARAIEEIRNSIARRDGSGTTVAMSESLAHDDMLSNQEIIKYGDQLRALDFDPDTLPHSKFLELRNLVDFDRDFNNEDTSNEEITEELNLNKLGLRDEEVASSGS